MFSTLKAKFSKTVILFFLGFLFFGFFVFLYFSVAVFQSHNILVDFQKHVNQDLLLHWQKPETISTDHTSDGCEGPTTCLSCTRHWGFKIFILCLWSCARNWESGGGPWTSRGSPAYEKEGIHIPIYSFLCSSY